MTSKGNTNKPDWSVFQPIKDRIAQLMSDGKPRSVLHVCQELQLGSNCNARKILASLASRGVLTQTYAKIDRHAVAVFTLARPGSKRRSNRAALGG